MKPTRMLYFLGAGPAAMDRVDTAHLFGELLGQNSLLIDWYLRTGEPGGPLMKRQYHGRPARMCGRSRLGGVPGRLLNKLQELIAIVHFFFTALRGRHEIVQVRDDFVAAPLALLAARLRGRRFVFWLSYPFPEARMLDAREGRARFPLFSSISGRLSAVVLYKIVLPWADHVFVQSAQMKRDILRPGVPDSRVTAVPMGLPDRDLPARLDECEDGLVLYLGTLARVRRLELVIQAFAEVLEAEPHARLAVVGEGDYPADRAALEQEAARLGIGAAVTFTGQLPRLEALGWVRRAAVCLSPFYPTFVLRSTSPTKLVEYMALGKAVVANDHPEQAEILAASGAGLCTAWDKSEFADAILTLLRDDERRVRAGVQGREWVMAHRLYSGLAAQLAVHYELIAHRATAR